MFFRLPSVCLCVIYYFQVRNFVFSDAVASQDAHLHLVTALPAADQSSAVPSNKVPFDDNTKDIIKKVIAKKCWHDYSSSCFKLDIAKFVNKLGSRTNYQLLPGIWVVRSLADNSNGSSSLSSADIPTEVAMSMVRSNDTSSELDNYLYTRLDQYLNSISIKVNLLQNPIMSGLKVLGSTLVTEVFGTSAGLTTGRSRKNNKGGGNSAAVWSAATMAALGFAGLAALSGKALMTATLALVLSLLCLLKGCGGQGKSSHYEIITKPAHLHDVEHVHSLSNPYGYARHFVEERIIPALNLFDSDDGNESRNVEAKIVPVHAPATAVQLPPPLRSYIPTNSNNNNNT